MSFGSAVRQSHSEALNLSQQTAQYLQKHASIGSSIQVPFLSYPESTEVWNKYEMLLLSCLRTGDDKAAHICLEKLVDRFGATNERVMGLRGLYQEAVAENKPALERILQEYNEVLVEDPVNTPVIKRRIALLRSLSKPVDAIDALVELVEASPTDIEAWTELSDLYLTQGLFSQAEFCLEEVLLVAPNAWNIHARLGEVLFISAASANESNSVRLLADSVRRFCRSVELCDGYLRGNYGLKMSSVRLLEVLSMSSKNSSPTRLIPENGEDLPPPSISTLQRLNERATHNLATMTTRANENNGPEIFAARKLVVQSAQSQQL